MPPDCLGYRLGQDSGQKLYTGLPDGVDRAEGFFQSGLTLGAKTGDTVQSGAGGAAAVALVVVGDGEAVSLLLDLANQRKEGLVIDDAQLPALRRH